MVQTRDFAPREFSALLLVNMRSDVALRALRERGCLVRDAVLVSSHCGGLFVEKKESSWQHSMTLLSGLLVEVKYFLVDDVLDTVSQGLDGQLVQHAFGRFV